MNPIAEEILMHYGIPRRSGRYPWGSGENPYQHSGDFLSRVDELKSQGMSDTEIAKAMGLTTTQYRTQKSLAKDERFWDNRCDCISKSYASHSRFKNWCHSGAHGAA